MFSKVKIIVLGTLHTKLGLNWLNELRVWSAPECEDEKHEQHTECSHIVHGLHQDHQLSAQSREEAHQFEHTQETKRPQHWKTPIRLPYDLPHTVRETHGYIECISIYKKNHKLKYHNQWIWKRNPTMYFPTILHSSIWVADAEFFSSFNYYNFMSF